MEEDRPTFRKRLEGQLLKFTNVMKGYQFRWVVIDANNGILEYYEKEDHKRTFKPRGCINLAYATVWPSDEDSQTFVVNASGGETLRLRASDAKERQLWVNGVRAVAEYQTEHAADNLKTASLSLAQLPSLLPMKDKNAGMLNGSNSGDPARRHTTRPPSTSSLGAYPKSGRVSEASCPRSSERPADIVTPTSPREQTNTHNVPTFIDSCQQLNELFRLLEHEANDLSTDIDNLYSSSILMLVHRNPEVAEVYRNLLILKATSMATIKSLKRCISGIQYEEVTAANSES